MLLVNRKLLSQWTLSLVIGAVTLTGPCRGDESAVAPAGTVSFEPALGGYWFVEAELKRQYEQLLEAVSRLEEQVQTGALTIGQARQQLKSLRDELQELRKQLDEEKVLVSPYQVHTETSEGEIEPGPERLLVVTADRLKVVGWDQPHIRYVLEKRVLGKPPGVQNHLDGLKVVHERRVASDLVGKTDQQMEEWRTEFMTPPKGKEWTEDQRLRRELTWRRDFAVAERFRPFLGREVDVVSITGLLFGEGNKSLSYDIRNPSGQWVAGSQWQRHADLTLYVPRCTAVLLRGCLSGLDVSGLDTRLFLTTSGARDRDDSGSFSIRNHNGSLTAVNVPLDRVEDVVGDVNITGTVEMVDRGSQFSGGEQRRYVAAPRHLKIARVTGSVTALFTRGDLQLDGIDGPLSVTNRYGTTRLSVADSLARTSHRVYSLSGSIHVAVTGGDEVGVPVLLGTSCGLLTSNFDQDQLDSPYSSTSFHLGGERQEWRFLHSPPLEQHSHSSEEVDVRQRLDAIISDRSRSPGLDLISVAGLVDFRQEK